VIKFTRFPCGARRLLCLLHECPNHDNPAADRRDIERAGDSIAARQPQFPQLPFQVFRVRLTQAFQPCLANTLGEPKEPRLHVSRKGGDFSGDGVVQDFNPPRHARLYLNFEISERGRNGLRIDASVFRTGTDELHEHALELKR
jgi:hypothetical protein